MVLRYMDRISKTDGGHALTGILTETDSFAKILKLGKRNNLLAIVSWVVMTVCLGALIVEMFFGYLNFG